MEEKNIAIARGFDLPISTKHSIEICDFIRNKSIFVAKKQLHMVLQKKLAIPLRRFHDNRGHRKGKIGPGFYPEKATNEIIKLLSTLEANVNNNGLSKENAYIFKAIANKASKPMHHGRMRRIFMKRTHIELVAKERSNVKKTETAQSEKKEKK
ncbi:MAG: 50S ribosomal protein L22 [Nanoarchaeota archaeon]